MKRSVAMLIIIGVTIAGVANAKMDSTVEFYQQERTVRSAQSDYIVKCKKGREQSYFKMYSFDWGKKFCLSRDQRTCNKKKEVTATRACQRRLKNR